MNEAGELVGILAEREAARQDLAYAAAPDEIRTFLEAGRRMWAPRTTAEWVRRGRLALKLRRVAAARDAFRAAADLSPDDGAVLAGYAAALAACGQATEALPVAASAATKALDPAALAELADVMRRLGRPARASELVGRALKADGHVPPPWSCMPACGPAPAPAKTWRTRC